MESLNKNGVSITQTPGEEKYIECCLGTFRGQIYIQYDYRHTSAKLFSTVAKTLEICRQKRDEWIKRQEQPPVYILFQTDVHRPKSSRVCFGGYSSEEKAIEAAKKNDLYTHQAEVVILECDIDNFAGLESIPGGTPAWLLSFVSLCGKESSKKIYYKSDLKLSKEMPESPIFSMFFKMI